MIESFIVLGGFRPEFFRVLFRRSSFFAVRPRTVGARLTVGNYLVIYFDDIAKFGRGFPVFGRLINEKIGFDGCPLSISPFFSIFQKFLFRCQQISKSFAVIFRLFGGFVRIVSRLGGVGCGVGIVCISWANAEIADKMKITNKIFFVIKPSLNIV